MALCLLKNLESYSVLNIFAPRDALLDLFHAALHLCTPEVPVAGVDRLELAAVDRHAGLGEVTYG